MRAPRRQQLMTQHPPRSTCTATLTLPAKSQVCRRRVTTQCFSSEFQPLPALLAVGLPPEPIGSSATTESKYRVAVTKARPSGPRLFFLPPGRPTPSISTVHVTKIGPTASPSGHTLTSLFAYSRHYARSICSPTGTGNETE